MSEKCLHEEVEITEFYTGHTAVHHRQKDGSWDHCLHPGDVTGKLFVECAQCGLSKVYVPSNTPKWVKERLDEAWEAPVVRSPLDPAEQPRMP